jgi:long-chain acyl-CoA synthetase
MLGYYKNEEETRKVIDPEGWFHTGDIGALEDNRFLRITDRKKELFKTSGAKFIAPQPIENKLKESHFIEQVMVIGENRNFPAALIVPSFAYIKEWAAKKGISFTGNDQLITDPLVPKKVSEAVRKVNKTLSHYEMIKKFEMIPHEWSIERGELTPKLSLKRKAILEEYASLVDKIYSSHGEELHPH